MKLIKLYFPIFASFTYLVYIYKGKCYAKQSSWFRNDNENGMTSFEFMDYLVCTDCLWIFISSPQPHDLLLQSINLLRCTKLLLNEIVNSIIRVLHQHIFKHFRSWPRKSIRCYLIYYLCILLITVNKLFYK